MSMHGEDVTNIELYEALKRSLNEDAARMIAEVVPVASEVATRDFVRETQAEHERRMDQRFERLEQRFDRMEERFFRWAALFIAPLWAGAVAAIVRVLVG